MRAPLEPEIVPAPDPVAIRTAGGQPAVVAARRGRPRRRAAGRGADRRRRRRHRLRVGAVRWRMPNASWRCTQPDCVLLDLNLPDANGIAALERIKERRPQHADRGAHRAQRRALRHVGGRVGRAGLPGQGPGRAGDAAARGAVRDRAQARRAHRGGTARQPTARHGERPPRARPVAVPAAAGRPRRRDRRAGMCPVGRTRCSAATSTTSSRRRTGRCTSWSATSPATAPTRPRSASRCASPGARSRSPVCVAPIGCGSSSGSLRTERAGKGIFATVLSLAIPPEGRRFTAVRAGHPGMLLHGDGTVEWLEPPGGPALGWRRRMGDHQVEWPEGTGLVLLTDGLFEGHSGRGNERLGEDGLLELARSLAALPGAEFVDALIDGAERRAAGARRADRRHRGGPRGAINRG